MHQKWKSKMDLEAVKLGYLSFKDAHTKANLSDSVVRARINRGDSLSDALSNSKIRKLRFRSDSEKKFETQTGFRTCSDCLLSKRLDSSNFIPDRKAMNGYMNRCADCMVKYRRQSKLRDLYQLTQTDVNTIFESQKGKCAGCGNSLKLGGKSSQDIYHIDHDPKSTDSAPVRIRGLLCASCNQTLAMLESKNVQFQNIVENSIYYLKNPPKAPTAQQGTRGSTDRDTKLWSRFAMTSEDFDVMLKCAGNACSICGDTEPVGPWCVDHDPALSPEGRGREGKKAFSEEYRLQLRSSVRGVLCNHCNMGIGSASDPVDNISSISDRTVFRLRSLVRYLSNVELYMSSDRMRIFNEKQELKARNLRRKPAEALVRIELL